VAGVHGQASGVTRGCVTRRTSSCRASDSPIATEDPANIEWVTSHRSDNTVPSLVVAAAEQEVGDAGGNGQPGNQ